ncbi:MAG TPA: L-threonylcarbamoyladenylate synthase [Urbifossiella sp.]|nr:L-threonylcarbamoyladenylate synthase [Urbifossiella sp.]
MITEVLSVDAAQPDPAAIRRAAAVLRRGGLVAFPTETVYGLGANSLDAAAVLAIFAVKGRPATNPVIVHVADPGDVSRVAATWPDKAAALANRFWPGPLTIVVSKRAEVPDVVTAGGPTVAIRCPAHPVARALIRASGVPLAAPSANRSTELSPTRAEHVLSGLDGRIDLLLDAGACSGGLESTVVDAAGERIRLLRHGLIGIPQLERIVGPVEVASEMPGIARSPGQMEKHYSPRTELRLVEGAALVDDLLEAAHAGKRVGSVMFHGEGFWPERAASQHISLPAEPGQAAALLYDALHRLDGAGLDLILVEVPPEGPEWAAIRDRLTRAAAR